MSEDSNVVEEPSSWQEFFQSRFERCNNAVLFKQARAHLKSFGLDKVKEELMKVGFVDRDTEELTTGFQPFNFFARIANNDQHQRVAAHDQYMLGQSAIHYAIVHNKPECDDHWKSSDPSWLGKASMSERHRFLITRNLHWEWFNVLTFGLISGPEKGVEMLEGMKTAALSWAAKAQDWPDPKYIGLFLVVWPLTTVPHAHLHIVDLNRVGPSFERLSKKMLSVDQAIEVLESEISQRSL